MVFKVGNEINRLMSSFYAKNEEVGEMVKVVV
jgi:hypothetical protein